jgi:hypothetical protein
VCAWGDPAPREALVSALVIDARAVPAAVDLDKLDEEQGQLGGLLALIAGQDVEPARVLVSGGSCRGRRRTG